MDSDAKRDALWKLYQEHCNHTRHHEAQRSTVAASMIAIASALLGVATYDKALTIGDAPMLATIFALGIFGAMFSAKQYERAAMHMQRARFYRDAIDADLTGQPLKTLKTRADQAHKADFPVLNRLRVNKFWLFLYLFVGAVGLALIVVALFWPTRVAECDMAAPAGPASLSAASSPASTTPAASRAVPPPSPR